MPQQGARVNIFVGSITVANLVRLHLHEYGVDARLENEHVGTMALYAGAGGGGGAVKVSVSVVDGDKAQELIKSHRAGHD